MGTIAEKINYLNQTKSIIKDAIEVKGVDVPEATPFRNYAQLISEIKTESLLQVYDEGYITVGEDMGTPDKVLIDLTLPEKLPFKTLKGYSANIQIMGLSPDDQYEKYKLFATIMYNPTAKSLLVYGYYYTEDNGIEQYYKNTFQVDPETPSSKYWS